MLNLLTITPVVGMIVKLEEIWNVIETTVIFVAIGLIVFAISAPAIRGSCAATTTRHFSRGTSSHQDAAGGSGLGVIEKFFECVAVIAG